jgi:hypothetical protein
LSKVKFHPRWGDRKIIKKAPGVVMLERETIDIVVAYDLAEPRRQKLKYYSLMGGLSKGEAVKMATKEFKRRQK